MNVPGSWSQQLKVKWQRTDVANDPLMNRKSENRSQKKERCLDSHRPSKARISHSTTSSAFTLLW